jgi:hypothetical protein
VCDTTEIALSSRCSVTDRVDKVKQDESNDDGMTNAQCEFTREVPNCVTINLTMTMMMIYDKLVTALTEDDF